jgi:hypothetical protein
LDISPTYFQDPFFKSQEAAQRYSDWKDRISPKTSRKRGVPNLWINGFFHSTISISVNGQSIMYDSTFSGADDIERKFAKIYGLNAEMRKEYIKNFLRPDFMTKVKLELRL